MSVLICVFRTTDAGTWTLIIQSPLWCRRNVERNTYKLHKTKLCHYVNWTVTDHEIYLKLTKWKSSITFSLHSVDWMAQLYPVFARNTLDVGRMVINDRIIVLWTRNATHLQCRTSFYTARSTDILQIIAGMHMRLNDIWSTCLRHLFETKTRTTI